ncbi:unnamed protein product, partial [Rotaria sordida]
MNYYRHRDNCSYCTPELAEVKQHEMEEKQQQLRALDDKQRPCSEWRRTNASCVQHTG